MPLILRIFLHSRNQQQNKNKNEATMVYRNYPFTPYKKNPDSKENQSKTIKNPNHPTRKQNINTMSL
jgi:hypothetical protein